MIEKTLRELLKNQDYCFIETQTYPFEGFVTDLSEDMIEMYVFSSKTSGDELDLDDLGAFSDDKMIERVVFPISHIEYIFRDQGLKIQPADLEVKKMLKDQILNSRKTMKKVPKTKKQKDDNNTSTKKK